LDQPWKALMFGTIACGAHLLERIGYLKDSLVLER